MLLSQAGRTALHLAASHGSRELVVALLERNAHLNARGPGVCTRAGLMWSGLCSCGQDAVCDGGVRVRDAPRVRSCRRKVKQHCTSRLAGVPRRWWPRCSSAMLTSMLEDRCGRACGVNVMGSCSCGQDAACDYLRRGRASERRSRVRSAKMLPATTCDGGVRVRGARVCALVAESSNSIAPRG